MGIENLAQTLLDEYGSLKEITMQNTKSSFSRFSVGEPYSQHITTWTEGSFCDFRIMHYELIMSLRRPEPAEILAARKGDAEFALVYERGIIFLLYRFGTALLWSDAPFSLWLLPPHERPCPPTAPNAETRVALMVTLIDAADKGRVKALRMTTFSPAFTATFFNVLRHQANEQQWIGKAAYDRTLAELYRQFPTTKSLLTRSLARTKGGA